MYDYKSAMQAYRNDPVFHTLVEQMVVLMSQLQMTPADLRAVANFAATLHEQRKERPLWFVPNWPPTQVYSGHPVEGRAIVPPPDSVPGVFDDTPPIPPKE